MIDIDTIGRTAFFIAYWRDEETWSPDPLFSDPYARVFLDERSRDGARRLEQALPAARRMVQFRVKYYDDWLSRQISLGRRQVLILGAGFDTRSLRCSADGVRFFEVDQAPLIAFKTKALRRNGIQCGSTFVPCDYTEEGLTGALSGSGFDPGLPTYVIWEGNTMYLPRARVLQTLCAIGEWVADSAISLDYVTQRVVAGATGYPSVTSLTTTMASLGSPFVSGFDDIGTVVEGSGFRVVENHAMADLACKYREGEVVDADILEEYLVCTLESSRESDSRKARDCLQKTCQ